MKKEFTKIIEEALILQLIRGYTIQDQYGYIKDVPSPLQQIVTTQLLNQQTEIATKVAEILGSTEIKKAVEKYIEEVLSIEYTLKSYQAKFVEHFKTVIEEEVVKDLGILLKGKKISITIE